MGLYNKLAQIQSAVKGLNKDTKAYSYKYVDGNKCLGSIRPMMCELGLLLMPEVKEMCTKEVTYKVWNDQARGLVDKTEILVTIKMDMTWVDTESGETLKQEWAGTGMNAFDKGFGSALTYGERYYLLKFFHIPTDKDDVDYLATTRDEQLAVADEKRATPVATPSPDFSPLDPNTYWMVIKACASGKKAKSGNDYRTDYQTMTNAGDYEMAQFDADVANCRTGQQANQQRRSTIPASERQ